MKRYFQTGLLVCIMWISDGFSQQRPFQLGFSLAPNVSWMNAQSQDYQSGPARVGYSWGFIGEVFLTENYLVVTGFNIADVGGTLEFPARKTLQGDTAPTTGSLTRKYKLGYLDIPLGLKMKTKMFGPVDYYGFIGFLTSFNIRARADDTFTYDDEGVERTQDNTKVDAGDDIGFFKESLMIGGGVEYFFDESTFLIAGIRYNNGLTNIMSGYNSVDPSIKQKAFLSYFELNFGIIF